MTGNEKPEEKKVFSYASAVGKKTPVVEVAAPVPKTPSPKQISEQRELKEPAKKNSRITVTKSEKPVVVKQAEKPIETAKGPATKPPAETAKPSETIPIIQPALKSLPPVTATILPTIVPSVVHVPVIPMPQMPMMNGQFQNAQYTMQPFTPYMNNPPYMYQQPQYTPQQYQQQQQPRSTPVKAEVKSKKIEIKNPETGQSVDLKATIKQPEQIKDVKPILPTTEIKQEAVKTATPVKPVETKKVSAFMKMIQDKALADKLTRTTISTEITTEQNPVDIKTIEPKKTEAVEILTKTEIKSEQKPKVEEKTKLEPTSELKKPIVDVKVAMKDEVKKLLQQKPTSDVTSKKPDSASPSTINTKSGMTIVKSPSTSIPSSPTKSTSPSIKVVIMKTDSIKSISIDEKSRIENTLEDGEIVESPLSTELPSHIEKPIVDGRKIIYCREYLLFYRRLNKTWPVDIAEPIPDVSIKMNARSPAEFARRDSGKNYGDRNDRGDRNREERRDSRGNDDRKGYRGSKNSGPPQRLDQRDESEMRGSRESRDSLNGNRGSRGGFDPRDNRDSKFGRGDKRPSYSHEPETPSVVLVVGANAWQPKSKLKNQPELDKNEQAMKDISRQTIAILNKLTPEHFTVLSKQILTLEISNIELLDEVIHRIFDKALFEPHYGYMYAVLCQKLNEHLPSAHAWLTDLMNNSKVEYKNSTVFRKRLLIKCQAEFEKGSKWASEDEECRAKLRDTEVSLEDKQALILEQETRYKSKLRSLGNLRFVGELFKQKMITEGIMHRCLKSLCEQETPDEEQTESLCKLMTTVGETLDKAVAADQMNAYFAFITKQSKELSLASRIRFMLLDLIELRQYKWVSRTESSGPKTLAQIRQESASGPVKQRPSPRDGMKPPAVERKRLVLAPKTILKNDKNSKTEQGWVNKDGKDAKAAPTFKAAAVPVDVRGNIFNALHNESEESEETIAEEEDADIQIDSPKLSGIITEWGSIYDTNEVVLSLEALGSHDHDVAFLVKFLEYAMDQKVDYIEKASKLFVHLHESDIISREDFVSAFMQYIETVEDIIDDVPLLYSFMGIFLSMLIEAKIFEFKEMNALYGSLSESPSEIMKLVGETIKAFQKRFGQEALSKEFAEFKVASILPKKSEEDLKKWGVKYGVESLV